MLSGPQTLGSIEQSLSEAKRDLDATNGQLTNAVAAKTDLQREAGEANRELASLRLDAIARDAVIDDLDASERQARSLLEKHHETLTALDAELASHAGSDESSQKQRAALLAQIETLGKQIDAAEAKTQSRLAKDPSFTAQSAEAAEAASVVQRAERKAERARQDRIEKGKPFEASPLFMYLWERGYGTSRYRASPLIRWLDGKVARLCGYAAARPNYSMLVSLPDRLEEHVEQVRAKALQQTESLEALEREAMEADGVAKLAASYAELEAELQSLNDALTKRESDHAAMQRRRSELIAGGSESYQKALDILTRAYRQETIRALYQDARATSMPDDDVIVERIDGIAERMGDLERERSHLAATQQAQVTRVTELEKIMAEFRRQRFDSGNSVFSDPNLISLVLSQFMKGVLSSGGVWDAIRRQQRFERGRADPDFGSGGLWDKWRRGRGPLGPIGGGFGGGLGGRSSGGRSSGGRSSGGRSSGGRSSGGGGFRTGGTF